MRPGGTATGHGEQRHADERGHDQADEGEVIPSLAHLVWRTTARRRRAPRALLPCFLLGALELLELVVLLGQHGRNRTPCDAHVHLRRDLYADIVVAQERLDGAEEAAGGDDLIARGEVVHDALLLLLAPPLGADDEKPHEDEQQEEYGQDRHESSLWA